MSLHSRFLSHWTGKDFCDDDNKRLVQNKYVQRLRDTCQHGFYMQIGREELCGVNRTTIRPDITRVCFSEIRLSQARRHAELYGGLGIGVHRDFILGKEGNPVFYVQNSWKGHVVENFAVIHATAEELVRTLEEAGKNRDVESVRNNIRDPLRHVMGYVKGMSDENRTELNYYDEMEWRVVDVTRLHGECMFRDENTEGVYRLKVTPPDIRLIVFPDKATRRFAIQDPLLRDYFNGN